MPSALLVRLLLFIQNPSLVVYHLQKDFGKSGWKVNGTWLFWSFQRKIPGSKGTSEKVVLFLRTEYSKQKFALYFSKVIFDTSFRPSRSFSGKWNWFVQMVNAILGRNLTVLNFAYHLPKPWTDQFALVNGEQPLFLISLNLQGSFFIAGYCLPNLKDFSCYWTLDVNRWIIENVLDDSVFKHRARTTGVRLD